jgi:hypothetical protein
LGIPSTHCPAPYPKKPGGIGADVAKVEGTVMELKRNWPVYCNPSGDKEQFWII